MKKKVDKKVCKAKKKVTTKKVVSSKVKKRVIATKKVLKKKVKVKAKKVAKKAVKQVVRTKVKLRAKDTKKAIAKKESLLTAPISVQESTSDKDLAILKKRSSLEIELDDDILDDELDLELEEDIKDLEVIDEGIDRSTKDLLVEQIISSHNCSLKEIVEGIAGVDFFKSDTDDCLENGCDNPASTLGYCRFHYIRNWSSIKHKQEILSQNQLIPLLEKMVGQNTISNLEAILADLTDDKSFYNALKELDIDVVGRLDDSEEEDDDVEFETAGPKDLDIEDEGV
jgi:hypothetical protein